MKKLTAILAAGVLAFSMAGAALADGSILKPMVPEEPKVEGIPDEYHAVVEELDVETIKDKDVADLYKALTDGESFAKELAAVLELDPDGLYIMSNDVKVDPAKLTALSIPVVFSIEDEEGISYTPDGDIKMSMVVEAAKELGEDITADDLVIALTNPEDGETVLVPVDSYDPETGEISAELPFPGIITLMLNSDTAEAETETEA